MQATRLERQIYTSEYGCTPQVEPGAQYLVGLNPGSAVVASCRILGCEYRPFDFERLMPFNPWTYEYPVGLIGRYCVSTSHRTVAENFRLQTHLLALAGMYARARGYIELAMYTFPRLVRFYERASFETAAPAFFHPGYGQLMVPMTLRVSTFLDQNRMGSKAPTGIDHLSRGR